MSVSLSFGRGSPWYWTFTRGPGKIVRSRSTCAPSSPIVGGWSRGGRLVVTPTPHLRQVVLKALSEIRTVVGLPRLRRKQREHALLGIERLPLDRDVPDPRERAGRDVEDQDRAWRIALDHRRRGANGRRHVAVVSIELCEGRGDIRRAAGWRRLAKSAGQPLAKRSFRHAELASKLHSRHGVRGLEQISKDDAAARELCVELNLFESPEALEVRDGLPHVSHRERPPGAGFQQLDERGLGRRLALDGNRDVGDRPAHVTSPQPAPGRARRRQRRAGQSERA